MYGDDVPTAVRLIRSQSNCEISRVDSSGQWYVSRINDVGQFEEFPIPKDVLERAEQLSRTGVPSLTNELDVTGISRQKPHARGPAKRDSLKRRPKRR